MTTLQAMPCHPSNSAAQEGTLNQIPVRLLASQVKVEQDGRLQPFELPYPPHYLALLQDIIEQFCDKYLLSYSETTLRHLLRKVVCVLEGRRQKGVREAVAAVVYCQYSGVIRLKLKDFALMNQLTPRLFNKRYVQYQTLLKRAQIFPEMAEGEAVKRQEKEEECNEKEEEDSSDKMEGNMGTNIPMTTLGISTPRQAIELIFDGIFKSQQCQSNRRELIQKMADRCTEIDPRIYEQMQEWAPNAAVRLYYAIFAHLKQLGMNISFTKYREAVSAFAGLSLKRAYAHATEKVFKTVGRVQLEQGMAQGCV